MTRSSLKGFRFLARAAACVAPLFFAAGSASALTVTGLQNTNSQWAAGDYAPGGNCAREPHITLALSGFTFTVAGQPIRPARSEWAPDYVRGADSAKATWFFPFEKSDDDYGPIVMSLAKTGRSVTLELENNTDAPLPGALGALLAGSPYKRCTGTTPAPAGAAVK
jgi:hypothetical protein